jgi:upstream activation factor subunit UAF30
MPAAKEKSVPAKGSSTPKAKASAQVPAPAAKKPAAKKVAAPAPTKATVAKPANAFSAKLTPSKELAAIVGTDALPRTEVVKQMWTYIKKHGLQKATNKRVIVADAKLKPIFKADEVTMFEMTKLVSAHLSH